jgi:hypothetical protein
LADKVEAAYRRGGMREKRRRMMADWAAYCASAPTRKGDNVVPMRAEGKCRPTATSGRYRGSVKRWIDAFEPLTRRDSFSARLSSRLSTLHARLHVFLEGGIPLAHAEMHRSALVFALF